MIDTGRKINSSVHRVCYSVMPDLIRHPGVVPAKVGTIERLGPGFHREPWIPAFAGMTNFCENHEERIET